MRWIEIYDDPAPVVSVDGQMVYSTSPRATQASDGLHYVLKGPDPLIVSAEALGYGLARLAGISVPPCALCRHPATNAILFASEMMAHRGDVTVLIQQGLVDNPEIITDCFAFDVWTANVDRNIGGFVAELVDEKKLQLRAYSIDFEKCHMLGDVSGITVTGYPARRLKMPTNQPFGRHCFARPFPAAACSRIAALTQAQIQAVFDEVATELGAASIPRYDSAPGFLHSRGQRLAMIAREVWDA